MMGLKQALSSCCARSLQSQRALRNGTLLCALSVACTCLPAQAQALRFGVIAHPVERSDGEAMLRNALADTDAANLAFVVVDGLKTVDEACSDALYSQRVDLLKAAQNGVIVSLAAADWTACRGSDGKSAAVERLAQLREMLFADEFSLGVTRLPLLRQSATPKFRGYAENARWEVDGILFATLHLPAGNNHYVSAGGRNGEFEDRQIANREWLQRLFALATMKKMAGVVLFADGDPLAVPNPRDLRNQRDGFADTRQNLVKLSGNFHGRVLLVHRLPQAARPGQQAGIVWRHNLGELGVYPAPGWTAIAADAASSAVFSLPAASAGAASREKQVRPLAVR